MRRWRRAVAACLVLGAVPAALTAQADGPGRAADERAAARATRSALLRVDSFRRVREAPGTVVLQVGSPTQFAAGHVPGARPVALGDVSTPRQRDALFLEIPETATLERWARAVGLSDATERIVVVPASDTLQSATRVLFTLAFMGFGDRVSLLDGGLSAWRAAGLAVETGEAPPLTPSTAPLTVRRDSSLLAVIDHVDAATRDDGVAVLDARLPAFFAGDGGGYPRPGRIPSARNIPFSSLTEGGALRDRDALRQLFTQAGVRDGQRVITYCHIGQQATLLWFAARELGFDVRLFDGSFQEWSASARPLDRP